MNFKIKILDREFLIDLNEGNHQMVKFKLIEERSKIVNILRKYKKDGLIKSIKKPVDRTLIKERGEKSRFSYRSKNTETELQKRLDKLVSTKREITETIEKIDNLF